MKQNKNKGGTSVEHTEVFGLFYYITLCYYIYYITVLH